MTKAWAALLLGWALAGCAVADWWGESTALRVDHAVEDAADPVERGGERGVGASVGLRGLGATRVDPGGPIGRYSVGR